MQRMGDERRRAPRQDVELAAAVATREGLIGRGLILDINAYGCRLRIPDVAAPDQLYVIDLTNAVAYEARVMWRQAPLIGTRFSTTWDLRAADAPHWLVALRTGIVRTDAAEQGIRVVWSSPGRSAR